MVGMHSSHPQLDPLLLALITLSLTFASTSRIGFSMMWGKFCHSCFEITAQTALALFGHFTLKNKGLFSKGGSISQTLPWVRHCTYYWYTFWFAHSTVMCDFFDYFDFVWQLILLLQHTVWGHIPVQVCPHLLPAKG